MKFGDYLKAQRDDRGVYYIEPVDGGRRVFEMAGWRKVTPTLNGHLAYALAVAMLLAGLGGLFIARRW